MLLLTLKPQGLAEAEAALARLTAEHGLAARPVAARPHTFALTGQLADAASASDAAEACDARLPHVPGLRARLTAAAEALAEKPWVASLEPVATPYVLVSAQASPGTRVVDVAGVPVGGPAIALMAGPCAVEHRTQLLACAAAARRAGARFLRGGAYKPRTSPYEFQGLGEAGLRLLADAAAEHDLRVVTEVVCPSDVATVGHYAHLLQVGARNMQNFALLRALGAQSRPVLLKRGLSATYREWLCAAEYVAAHGNPNVILCERGIRTFEPDTRNTLDVAAVPVLRTMTHLPIVVDPSHATGRSRHRVAAARAGVAAGADGVLVEVHPHPGQALSDGAQSLTLPELQAMAEQLGRVAHAVDRTFVAAPGNARTQPAPDHPHRQDDDHAA